MAEVTQKKKNIAKMQIISVFNEIYGQFSEQHKVVAISYSWQQFGSP